MIQKEKVLTLVTELLDDYNVADVLEFATDNLNGGDRERTAKMMWYSTDKGFICIGPDEQITEQRVNEVKEMYNDVMKYWDITIIWYQQMVYVLANKYSLPIIDDIESELIREEDPDAYDRQRDDALTDNQ